MTLIQTLEDIAARRVSAAEGTVAALADELVEARQAALPVGALRALKDGIAAALRHRDERARADALLPVARRAGG